SGGGNAPVTPKPAETGEAGEEREALPLTSQGVTGPGGGPDPWGVKRAENLIASLTGVLSARVVVTPLGEVSEIHVLTMSDMQPKQVVRNIESALMAQLGMKIDHRKISVAQTADVRPIEQMQEEAVRSRANKRVEALDRKFGRVAVPGRGGGEGQVLTGTCEVRESEEGSSVVAVLDATNGWADARG